MTLVLLGTVVVVGMDCPTDRCGGKIVFSFYW